MNDKLKQQGEQLNAVLLQKDHRHEGELKLAGSTIHVTTADKNWLLAHHVIAPSTLDE